MNKIVYIIAILFLIIFNLTGSCYAAGASDVSSLFYIQGKMPSILPFLLLYMLGFSFVALFLANAYFIWLKTEQRIKLLEAFAVDKLYKRKNLSESGNQLDNHLIRGILEDNIILGGNRIRHCGVYLLGCKDDSNITVSVIRLMENITAKWNRPILYTGHKEPGILESILKIKDYQETELRKFEKKLSRYLFMLPAFHPNPDKIIKAAHKLKKETDLGAIVIENTISGLDLKEIFNESVLKKFFKISWELKLPVFIVYREDKGKAVTKTQQLNVSCPFLITGEINLETENEIHTVFNGN